MCSDFLPPIFMNHCRLAQLVRSFGMNALSTGCPDFLENSCHVILDLLTESLDGQKRGGAPSGQLSSLMLQHCAGLLEIHAVEKIWMSCLVKEVKQHASARR